ncbi:CheR family methyltransferase [Deinococcus sp. QL22]|uniref:CheR family methyltransferase n=1 Tax=Deinococcus sp. QL22 TaxID=2939437 RepID=UPI002016C9A6|nr:CheR family methyltransferase [Deinococcus sp. QL22]UQN10177.1 PAS domain-containing protein [Deinococcus sp. QL22]
MPQNLSHLSGSPLNTPHLPSHESPLCVVGLGGSADGLDSYEGFFLGLAPVSGLAFVVVAPPDPLHGSLMPETLQRCTTLPVLPIEDGMAAQADRVYLLPPGYSLTLFGGVLRLDEPIRADGRLVDRFFESLALERGEQAVGILFSGLTGDGTQGALALNKLGGRVLMELQHPDTAEPLTWPAAALQVADAVLPAEDLMVRLLELTVLTRLLDTDDSGLGTTPLGQILRLMRAKTGYDFIRYKRTTLVRRINRRMKSRGVHEVAQYLQLLESSPPEVETLFQDFTINVTRFFRDPEAFEVLRDQLRILLQARPPEQDTVRVWVAACSTGEEAYSIAMVLHELMDELDQALKIQMFATDIDASALRVARQGRYSTDSTSVLSPERLERHFELKDGSYQVRAEVREGIVFALHSTFGDPPFTRLDLLSCRNMLIYVQPELQHQLMGLFAYALKPAGLLLLGASETAGSERDLFVPLNSRWKLYRRTEGGAIGLPTPNQSFTPGQLITFPAVPKGSVAQSFSARTTKIARQLQAALLAEFTPPTVVVDRDGEIVFVHGRTARYLELSPGHSPNNVFDLVPDHLRYQVQSAVHQAHTERRRVIRQGLVLEGGTHLFDVVVRPLQTSGTGLVMVSFQAHLEVQGDGPASLGLDSDEAGQVLALELELREGREALRATFDEMAVSMEELRSSNEELQTTNEELQSTNEELMTSKEELQSLNEELNTLSNEHRVIIEHQTQTNDDTRNLLDNAGTATLFLSNDLRIKRFTPLIEPIVHLTAADEGRPLTDFNVKLRYDLLLDDLRRVLTTLEPFEAQVQVRSGEWYLMRLSPYRTTDNRIDGVVLTFTNIELIKSLEWRLVQSLNHTESVLHEMQDPLLVLDQHLRAVTASRALLQWLSTPQSPPEGKALPGAEEISFDVEELRRRLRAVIATEEPLSSVLLELNTSQQHTRKIQEKGEAFMQEDAHREETSSPRVVAPDSATEPAEGTAEAL